MFVSSSYFNSEAKIEFIIDGITYRGMVVITSISTSIPATDVTAIGSSNRNSVKDLLIETEIVAKVTGPLVIVEEEIPEAARKSNAQIVQLREEVEVIEKLKRSIEF